jgi:adenine-specific DNA-methyltransferase
VIAYLGSKRVLAPFLGSLAAAVGARTAVDLFTGTTRVAQALKRDGVYVTAVDTATYAEAIARCFVATDAADIDDAELDEALARLSALPPTRGYVTEVFCEQARFFQPDNGMRIDAIRDGIRDDYAGTPLEPILLTALLMAADRVDSTTGVQMAYLKDWAPRSYRPLELRRPDLLSGGGAAVRGDALDVAPLLSPVDFAYLDPPYNQHRYFSNYHVWETLVRWDAPAHYGVACKRIDARDHATRSRFNSRRKMPAALAELIGAVRAEVVVVSHNDESWITPDELTDMLLAAGHEEVRRIGFDSARYVGARIGIHDPSGRKVGRVGRLRNTEFVFVAGARDRLRQADRIAC